MAKPEILFKVPSKASAVRYYIKLDYETMQRLASNPKTTDMLLTNDIRQHHCTTQMAHHNKSIMLTHFPLENLKTPQMVQFEITGMCSASKERTSCWAQQALYPNYVENYRDKLARRSGATATWVFRGGSADIRDKVWETSREVSEFLQVIVRQTPGLRLSKLMVDPLSGLCRIGWGYANEYGVPFDETSGVYALPRDDAKLRRYIVATVANARCSSKPS